MGPAPQGTGCRRGPGRPQADDAVHVTAELNRSGPSEKSESAFEPGTGLSLAERDDGSMTWSGPTAQPLTLSTDSVSAAEAFEYWHDMICATFVKLTASSNQCTLFNGRIEHSAIRSVELSVVEASSQRVTRTKRLVSEDAEDYILASVQLRGRGRIDQDGRSAHLSPGHLAFYDSTRPYTLDFANEFKQLVIQLPRAQLGIRNTQGVTALTLGSNSPGPLVADFFCSLSDAVWNETEEEALRPLLPHALGLLSAAAAFAARDRPTENAGRQLLRERALRFMKRNLADPGIDSDAVAAACGVSRRSLYRAVGDGGVARQLRELRIRHAQMLLDAEAEMTIGAIAHSCGFESESGFSRAFRTVTDLSPSEYRETGGTSGQ